MELVTSQPNRSRLDEINRAAIKEAESVEAAVAYVTEVKTLIQACLDFDVKLTLWGRYDDSQPVAIPVLEKFLQRNSPNFVFRYVPDIFHPKVIWWHGYGAYIGSANLTHRAWFGGIEAGVFFTEEDLSENGLDEGLIQFLEDVDMLSHPLTKELVEEANRFTFKDPIQSQMESAKKRFEASRLLPRLNSLLDVTRKPAGQRRRAAFLKEWNETIEILRGIAKRIVDFRPTWVAEDVPAGAQADQFLHAYYYQQVKDGASHPFREFHKQNRDNPDAALVTAMKWWQSLEHAPGWEDEMLHTWLPHLQDKLGAAKLLTLSKKEFSEVCAHIHAMRDHGLRVSWKSFGLEGPLPKMSVDERANYFGNWLYDQKSSNGSSVLEVINHVLHDGPRDKTPERIFEACFNHEHKTRHLGVSSLGEMVGWVHPDYSPPRNGRTSKALVALGFNVAVHSE
jgi:hypothetical protein